MPQLVGVGFLGRLGKTGSGSGLTYFHFFDRNESIVRVSTRFLDRDAIPVTVSKVVIDRDGNAINLS